MKDGGPAFPNKGDNTDAYPYYDGMTLRDWYAGMALQALLSSPQTVAAIGDVADERGDQKREVLAEISFQAADAMIAERDK